MKVLLASIPSTGHFNPILVAARTLKEAGHETAIYTSVMFRDKIEKAGVRFFPLPEDADQGVRDFGASFFEKNKVTPGPEEMVRLLTGALKFFLPAGCCLLVALFYLSAFFPTHRSWEAAAFIFVGLSVLAGLHHATSIPHAVPLFVDDVVHVVLGALAVQLAIRSGGMTAVQAASLVGGLAWLSSRVGLLDERVLPASVYCGAFAGMTSSHVLPGTPWIVLAGIIAGVIYSWAKHFWVGIGGKLGTIAFAGTALTVLVARLAGWNHADPAAVPVDGPMLWAVFSVGIVAAPLTFVLAEPCKFGAVCASAVPSAVLALGINLLSAPWQMKMMPLAAAWLGASFAGMTSMERLAGRYWMLPLLGLIFAFLFVGSGPRVHGFGGLLGTTALVSVLAGLGLARWWPTSAITTAKHA
jgi:hypothetical protein